MYSLRTGICLLNPGSSRVCVALYPNASVSKTNRANRALRQWISRSAVRSTMRVTVDYGYRDSKNFWFHRKTKMRAELLPIRKQSLDSVRYAADRADDKVKFSDDALETILNVPRVFLPLVLKGCVEWARENNCTRITAAEMKIIKDKRAKEKSKK